ncbi:hypothetical protein CDD82_6975 [Ophiocordyceps australis]|uniref:Uncharacterized protein n=1 Tax=Ophiocordyceps australis TaxID=1399860 RepID=A0A2C5YPI5_9HYPO|nr:hypothetical protein CDD82_6975 [Ophiocordyceps australis]
MVSMMLETSDLSLDSLRQLLGDALENQSGTRNYQVRWFRDAAKAKRPVCWPDAPSYTVTAFNDVWAYIGALLTDPTSIHLAVAHRFMDYPPGYPDMGSVHVFSELDYEPKKMVKLLKDARDAAIGVDIALYFRSLVDKWGGLLGRVMFHSTWIEKPQGLNIVRLTEAIGRELCEKWIVPHHPVDGLTVLESCALTHMILVVALHSPPLDEPPPGVRMLLLPSKYEEQDMSGTI